MTVWILPLFTPASDHSVLEPDYAEFLPQQDQAEQSIEADIVNQVVKM